MRKIIESLKQSDLSIEIIEKIEQMLNESSDEIRVCHKDCVRMVSFKNAFNGIPSLIKEISKSEDKKQTFARITMYVKSKKPNEKITTKKILKELGWDGITYGDFILKCLECLVCMGVISKVRFSKGRPGHVFVNKPHICPYADMIIDQYGIPETYACRFDWNNSEIIKKRYP